ncbi:MAG: transcriptional repressor LexA [Thermoleophilia bacterium]|nr:transcriptional repressor LexA [Thermoleophilia bacterium]
MTLSNRQREILDVIKKQVREQGYPPTVREIGEAVGLSSPASVHGHLAVLEEKGCIRRSVSKRRALEVVGDTGRPRGKESMNRLPVVGQVAAGRPLLAEENVEDMVDVPGFMAEDDECFVLRIKGSSMINAGILEGDLVVVRRQDWAENGQIVVAMLGDEATVKRFYRESGYVRLQPENDAMEPIITKTDPRILGRVSGVMRRV